MKLAEIQQQFTDYYRTQTAAVEFVQPQKGSTRHLELHPSSFPPCGVRQFRDVCLDPPTGLDVIPFSMAFYTSIGSAFHTTIQHCLGAGGRMMGDYTCPSCGHHCEATLISKCPKCESLMQYEELGIRVGKRTVGHVDGLFMLSDGTFVVIDYKGLALDTPIPTPSGWVTMGALEVGDCVFDSQGKVCKVVSKSAVHKRKCYRVTFNDGATVVCDDEHLWVTTSGGNTLASSTTSVKDTETIKKTLLKNGQAHHRVELNRRLDLPDTTLPVHPYVLGCWLGDGTADRASITKPDMELFDNIQACGYEIGEKVYDPRTTDCCTVKILSGLKDQLRVAGVLENKHIPKTYLRASWKQRLLLLRGLMDTDGSWNETRQQAVFSSCDPKLSNAVAELVRSLGVRALVNHAKAKGFGKIVDVYQVTFRPIRGMNPFWLTRKANLVKQGTSPRSRFRVITSVEPIVAVPTQCIQVDSPDRTYLCTRDMIPTHNTTSVKKLDEHRLKGEVFPVPSNVEQIRSYVVYLSMLYDVEIVGWMLVYVARDNFDNFEVVAGKVKAVDVPALKSELKRWDKHCDVVVRATSLKDIQVVIEEKPCTTIDDYYGRFHNPFSPCPLHSVCFNPKQLKAALEDCVEEADHLPLTTDPLD